MKNFLIPAALVLGLASLNSCTQLTQTARLAEGPVVLGVDTIKAHVNVDTTTSLIGMSSTTHKLGFIRLGDNELFIVTLLAGPAHSLDLVARPNTS